MKTSDLYGEMREQAGVTSSDSENSVMKSFNTTVVCVPTKHYMVDISERVKEIRKLVDSGRYFTINRARQYGKTTTLNALSYELKEQYTVLSLDFQDISNAVFKTEGSFVQGMARIICDAYDFQGVEIEENIYNELKSLNQKKADEVTLDELFRIFVKWCNSSVKPIVLIIDEVDTATNNQVFLDFLAALRSHYLKREKIENYKIFHSVILAGVTDVKNLKIRIRGDADEKENSPWNIAADFTVDMSLSTDGIKNMLDEYEKDHHTGMDSAAIAKQIRDYTNGYPFLVSRICQLIDERMVPGRFNSLEEAWTADGVEEAVKAIITEKNTLFESLMEKVKDYHRLREQLKYMLFRGETVEFLPDSKEQEQLMMYGFIVNDHNTVAVANKIFEMRLYKYFVGESRFSQEMRREALKDKPEFIRGGELDIPLIMERFIASQKIIRNIFDEEAEKKFIEEEGREKFLTYLSPILNGVGTYSVEDRTSDNKRMDVVIHYNGRRYIIELKIWHGERYNEKGEKQISEYLDRFGLTTGYMLSFNFNKKKEPGVKKLQIGDKVLFEGMV